MSRQVTRFLVVALLILGSAFTLPFISHAGDNTWTTTGPYGVRFSGIYIDPHNDQVMYATTSWINATPLYKSTDGGVTWRSSSSGVLISSRVADHGYNHTLAFDKDNSSIIYVARGDGLYRSKDGGTTWERKNPLAGYEEPGFFGAVSSVVVSPLDGAVLAGAPIEPGNIVGGVFRSLDKGETWERGSGLDIVSVEAFAIAPGAPNIIYVGGNTGFYKSSDGGKTWTSLGDTFGGSPVVKCITVDPHNSQVVYISIAGAGLFRTGDGGATWQPIGAGISGEVHDLVIDPGNQQILYAASAYAGVPGVYRSVDNIGTRWEFFDTGLGSRDVLNLALDHRTPQSIFAGTMAGIWKRTMTSDPADFGVSINVGTLFTNNPAVELTLTAPDGTSEMMLSNDGGFAGAQWEPFQSKRAWTITSVGSGLLPRIVYAKFRTYGEISGLYQDDIVLDQTSPTGSATIVAPSPASGSLATRDAFVQEAPYVTYLPLLRQTGKVRLALTATDDLSGIGEMRIASTSTFAGASWVPFASTAERIISNPQEPIYVQFRDRAMNVSAPILAK